MPTEIIKWWTENNQQYQALIVVGAICVLICSAAYIDWRRARRTWKRRGKALKRARMDYVRTLVVDTFIDTVETYVYNEVLTRTEAKEIYRELKICFPRVRDAFPSPILLKEDIRKRLAKGNEPLPFPDKDVKPRRGRHMFDKAA